MKVESLDEGSKTDDERSMVTPWRSRFIGNLEALPLLLLSPYLSKLFRVGLYEWALSVSFVDRNLTFIPRRRWLADGSVGPTRFWRSKTLCLRQLPGFAQLGTGGGARPTLAL